MSVSRDSGFSAPSNMPAPPSYSKASEKFEPSDFREVEVSGARVDDLQAEFARRSQKSDRRLMKVLAVIIAILVLFIVVSIPIALKKLGDKPLGPADDNNTNAPIFSLLTQTQTETETMTMTLRIRVGTVILPVSSATETVTTIISATTVTDPNVRTRIITFPLPMPVPTTVTVTVTAT
ncbi:hypothetical protein PVAG01_01867 [Phlyctema vagabunda]|uniref:Transmembrane protein n=1 Tax=Phlyctema vagabunda TaxID=108571 RepID=A0ABR4PYE3_9HELO